MLSINKPLGPISLFARYKQHCSFTYVNHYSRHWGVWVGITKSKLKNIAHLYGCLKTVFDMRPLSKKTFIDPCLISVRSIDPISDVITRTYYLSDYQHSTEDRSTTSSYLYPDYVASPMSGWVTWEWPNRSANTDDVVSYTFVRLFTSAMS